MHLKLELCDVRSLRPEDAEPLAVHANNRAVWINLRDGFPHPYTLADADNFIERCLRPPETTFAIALEGKAVGAIGFVLGGTWSGCRRSSATGSERASGAGAS